MIGSATAVFFSVKFIQVKVEMDMNQLVDDCPVFLPWQSKKAPLDFAKEVAKEADQYNGFNLIVAEISSKTMFYITNRPTNDSPSLVTEVSPGIHVLTNAQLDSPWPKVRKKHPKSLIASVWGFSREFCPISQLPKFVGAAAGSEFQRSCGQKWRQRTSNRRDG